MTRAASRVGAVLAAIMTLPLLARMSVSVYYKKINQKYEKQRRNLDSSVKQLLWRSVATSIALVSAVGCASDSRIELMEEYDLPRSSASSSDEAPASATGGFFQFTGRCPTLSSGDATVGVIFAADVSAGETADGEIVVLDSHGEVWIRDREQVEVGGAPIDRDGTLAAEWDRLCSPIAVDGLEALWP